MKIAKKIKAIPASATMAVSTRAKELAAMGKDVIGFGLGEPDFDTPEHIKRAAKKGIDDGYTKYTPAAGLPELREAIAEKLQRENDLDYRPEQIVVSCGAKHSLFNTMMTMLEPGDEVIVPAPYWVSYVEQVRAAGGVPVIVQTREADGFVLQPGDFTAAVTEKTRALVLNSPSNPTGAVYSAEQLTAIGRIALERGISVITDEIYEHLVYGDAEQHSVLKLVPGLAENSVLINGVSKSYAMTGWRIGYAAAPLDFIKAMTRLQSHAASGPSTPSQIAAIEAIRGDQSCVGEMKDAFVERRRFVVSRLSSIEGLSCPEPKGAFYAFFNVSAHYGRTIGGREIVDSTSFCAALLEEQLVAMVPGAAFGADDYVRLSYAASMEKIAAGLDRLESFLSK